MKNEMGFQDATMNLFKLKLYNWNVNDARKYYKNDKFCLNYCIDKNQKYGCKKMLCPRKHTINLTDLIYVHSQEQKDYKQCQLLCLYLMYKNVYNDNNPALFDIYATTLMDTGTSQQDYKKSEMYYLKALAIDNDRSGTHNNYALLLDQKMHHYDKAEYRYNISLKINPNDAINHANFALFLISQRHKYQVALSHSEKACKLKPNLSWAHYMKAKSLFKLKRYDLSLKEYEKCLQLHAKDGRMTLKYINDAKEHIHSMSSKIATDDDQSRPLPHDHDQKQQQDEKTSGTESMSTFSHLSIIDAMDEIIAQIMQIDQLINDSVGNINIDKKNVQHHLSQVTSKLRMTRTKCASNNNDPLNPAMPEKIGDNYSDLKSKLATLNQEIIVKSDNTNESTLALLIELRKLEQKAKIQQQKIEVKNTFLFNLFFLLNAD